MKQKTKDTAKKNTVNLFGALGYLFCVLQWFWVTILYFSVIQTAITFTIPDTNQHAAQISVPQFTLPDPVMGWVLGSITAIMIAVTIYALVSMPAKTVKASSTIVYKAAQTMAPVAIKAQHKKDTRSLRAKITPRLVFFLKLLLIIIPTVLTFASGILQEHPIEYSIVTIIGCGLALFSLVSFTAQYVVSRLLRVKVQELW